MVIKMRGRDDYDMISFMQIGILRPVACLISLRNIMAGIKCNDTFGDDDNVSLPSIVCIYPPQQQNTHINAVTVTLNDFKTLEEICITI